MADLLTDAQRNHAEALAMLIERGYVSTREALDWACALVAAQPEPSEELLELAGALRPHPPDVVRMLRALPGATDSDDVFCRFAARLRQFLREQPEAWPRVARELELMAIGDELPARVSGYGYQLGHDLDLAEEGYGKTLLEVRADLLSFLEKEAGLSNARPPSHE